MCNPGKMCAVTLLSPHLLPEVVKVEHVIFASCRKASVLVRGLPFNPGVLALQGTSEAPMSTRAGK